MLGCAVGGGGEEVPLAPPNMPVLELWQPASTQATSIAARADPLRAYEPAILVPSVVSSATLRRLCVLCKTPFPT